LTLYELLTLTPMFGDSKQGPLLKQKTNGEFVAPRSIDSQIPADLETITLKASATDAAHRYRTAAEMADDLDRFLDERPILARRISLGERLWRWSRRNPAVASLSSLAVMLLMVIAAILAWANYRTGLALRAAEQQHKRAVDAAGEALREEARAEGNLRLALGAFEGIMENVARRGAPDALEVDLGDGEVVYDVVVSNADAALLQTLLGFYDQFARQNELDLQLETATAYMRVGDIYQRLGDLTAASKAYQAALAVYERLLNSAPDDIQLSLAKAEALNELAISLGRGGELVPATQNHRQAERLLRERPSLMETAAGKFELARTLNLLASRPFVAGHDRVLGALARSQRAGPGRRRGPAGIGGRPPGGPAGPRSGELAVMPESREARELLEQLVRDEPGNPDYRLALAETFQAELRFHQLRGRPADAEETLTEAVQFLQQAARDFPKVPAFQYALADTLSLAMPSGRRHDKSPLQHIERAISIAAKLVMTYPQVPEYRSLQGRLESELAAAQVEAGQLDTAEQHYLAAITQQRSLVDRYESVSLYRLSYAQSLYELAQLQRRRKQFDAARAGLKAAAVQIEPFAQTDQPSRHLCQRFLHQVYQRLATTCRDLDDDTQAEIYAQKAKSLAVMDRVPRMGRFRLRPGDLHRRGWRGFGGEQYRL
jgi:tetratricopeptide (TPR) repeat protein